MSFTPSGSPEFHDAVTNTVTSVIRSDADHDEMMGLIADLNKVKADYKALAKAYDRTDAACNEALNILREHLDELSISREEVNARLNAARDEAAKKHG